jgi:P-type conjugative transfer protein TrbJ
LSQQVQQYQLQLQQYKSQILQATGIGEAAQIYAQAQDVMGQVTGQVNMYRNGGLIKSYMENAQNLNYWLSSTQTPQSVDQSANYWSSTQQSANRQMVQQLAAEEDQLKQDAYRLNQLQSQAPTLQTERQALDLANEMAGLQQKSLLAIRTLMVSEQQALAARSGTVSTREAQQEAADKDFLTPKHTYSEHQGYDLSNFPN